MDSLKWENVNNLDRISSAIEKELSNQDLNPGHLDPESNALPQELPPLQKSSCRLVSIDLSMTALENILWI